MIRERISALLTNPFALGFQHRIILRGKRQFVDDHQRKRFTLDVDPFPKTHAPYQNRPAGTRAEAFDEFGVAVFVLQQHFVRTVVGVNPLPQPHRRLLHRAVARAEQESTSAHEVNHGPTFFN